MFVYLCMCVYRCVSTRKRSTPWRSVWWCLTVSWRNMNAGCTPKNNRPTRSSCSTRAVWMIARGDWGNSSWRKTRRSKASSAGHNPFEAQCVCMCVWRSSLSKAQKKACRPPHNVQISLTGLALWFSRHLSDCVLCLIVLHVVVWMWNYFVMLLCTVVCDCLA